MSSTKRAPVAVFAYNRADRLDAMMNSLRRCDGYSDYPVTIFVDGPKGDADWIGVEAVRALVTGYSDENVSVVLRDRNLGLARSVFEGVSSLCSKHGRAIVLEDDLLLSTRTLDYFSQGLDAYETNERIYAVCAYMFAADALSRRDEAFFLPVAHPWGWATWDRAWKGFDLATVLAPEQLGSAAFKRSFDVTAIRDYSAMLNLAMQGSIDSWFIRWYLHVHMNGGLCLFPPETYVLNDGINAGTHATGLNPYYRLMPRRTVSERPFRMPPARPAVDYAAIDAISSSYDARLQKAISFLGRCKRTLRSMRRSAPVVSPRGSAEALPATERKTQP